VVRRWRRAALTLLALACTARAGDRLEVQRVAFSPDGTRALVVTGGVRDGSGFSIAAVTVLDTGTGRVRQTASVRSETRPVPALVDDLLRRERARLFPLGLWPGKVSRPVYSRRFPVQAPQWAEGVPAGRSVTVPVLLWTRPVPVRLSVQALPSRCSFPEMLPSGERPAGFTLSVNGQTVHTDRSLPAGRACAARYALEAVYVQGNRAVFLVRAYTPGFEGPNAEVVAVAATLR